MRDEMTAIIDHYRVTVGPLRRPDLRRAYESLSEAVSALHANLASDTAYAQIDAVNEDGSYREVVVLDLRGVYA